MLWNLSLKFGDPLVLFSCLRDTSLHFNSSHYLISSRHNCPLNPPQTHSKLQQPASQLLDYCHSTISSGKACHSRIILSAPLSSVRRCPGSQRHSMAAAPVRQRSGSAGPRTQLPPCYYEGYLEKRGPKEKVGSPGAHPHSHARTHTIHAFQCHVVSAARVMNSGVGGQCVCASPDDLPFPESCQLPCCAQTVEAEGWRYRWSPALYTWQRVADQTENVHHPKSDKRNESEYVRAADRSV